MVESLTDYDALCNVVIKNVSHSPYVSAAFDLGEKRENKIPLLCIKIWPSMGCAQLMRRTASVSACGQKETSSHFGLS